VDRNSTNSMQSKGSRRVPLEKRVPMRAVPGVTKCSPAVKGGKNLPEDGPAPHPNPSTSYTSEYRTRRTKSFSRESKCRTCVWNTCKYSAALARYRRFR
jgi:hypothetical protein